MKRLLQFVLVFLLSVSSLFGQKKDLPDMSLWYGGQINFDLRSSINTMGGGQGAGGFGRVIAPGVSTGAASIFSNPSELGMIKKPIIYFDSKLSVTTDAFGYDATKELNKSVSTATKDFLKDTSSFRFNGQRTDSKFTDFNFGQASQIGSFALALPINDRLVLGFGVTYPIDISSNFLLAGLQTKITSQKKVSDQTISIDLPLSVNFATDFHFTVNMISMGAAGKLFESKYGETYGGFSINRYSIAEYININLQIDGMLVIKKKLEYHFNDPSDPNIDWAAGESNKFYWRARGNYKSDGWGYRMGITHKGNGFNAVIALDIVPKFTMSDPNFINESYQPKFIKGRPLGKKDEAIDIVIDSLKLDKPNLTVATQNPFSSTAETSYPSSLTVGGDVKWGAFTFGLNYVKYLSEFSFLFSDYKMGKKLDGAVKFSSDVQLADTLRGWGYLLLIPRALFLDIDGLLFQFMQQGLKLKVAYKNPRYRIEGGVLFGDPIVEGFTDPDQAKGLHDALKMPLPTGFAISREYSVFEKLNVSVMVFGFPDFALRFGFGYNL
ncbi:MAG: hypothetical protein LWX56_04695 [Ignavibacteria bacterium]|nr:hypothetical protein [Ignavibacteria bacterium]